MENANPYRHHFYILTDCQYRIIIPQFQKNVIGFQGISAPFFPHLSHVFPKSHNIQLSICKSKLALMNPRGYKDDFTIGGDGVPVCREGHAMRRDGTESDKGRTKFKCPKISFTGGKVTCTCENPCSTAKYGRTVHLVMKDNPRLFNDPPRSSREWKLEYNARTSAERCNKREKIDYKLEDGRYRSSKMWYCRLFAIMMCQHLDAWILRKTSPLKDVL